VSSTIEAVRYFLDVTLTLAVAFVRSVSIGFVGVVSSSRSCFWPLFSVNLPCVSPGILYLVPTRLLGATRLLADVVPEFVRILLSCAFHHSLAVLVL